MIEPNNNRYTPQELIELLKEIRTKVNCHYVKDKNGANHDIDRVLDDIDDYLWDLEALNNIESVTPYKEHKAELNIISVKSETNG